MENVIKDVINKLLLLRSMDHNLKWGLYKSAAEEETLNLIAIAQADMIASYQNGLTNAITSLWDEFNDTDINGYKRLVLENLTSLTSLEELEVLAAGK